MNIFFCNSQKHYGFIKVFIKINVNVYQNYRLNIINERLK